MTGNPIVEVALKYMELGLPLFPIWPLLADGTCACRSRFDDDDECVVPGKHPATRWRRGSAQELPSRDPARALAWWGPGVSQFGIPREFYGIGMPTGAVSGIFVVDLDNKPEADGIGNLARLVEEHGPLPDGPRVLTPSGGVHLYFRAPAGGGPTKAAVIAAGIDTRGEGGMVVLAPSMHKSGKRYRWDKKLSLYLPDRLPDVPGWLLEPLRSKRGQSAATQQGQGASPWPVSHEDAAATLAAMLDSAYVRWMVETPEDVSREAWRTLATNLHAACAGHSDLLTVADAAWHAVSAADHLRYRQSHAARQWADAAKSPPISFEHADQHGAPEEVCSSGAKNLVLEARQAAYRAPKSTAFIDAALAFLTDAPGRLLAMAEERGVTPRDVLLEEGFLEDTSGYVKAVSLDEHHDGKGGSASPA